jgi:anti-sigma regulatory factor (Ser/Thr protein kinase)
MTRLKPAYTRSNLSVVQPVVRQILLQAKLPEEIWENFETIMREGAQLLTEGKRKIGKIGV